MVYVAEKWFGISTGTFVIIVGLWALIFVMLFGEDRLAGIATCFMTFITALLLGKLGPWIFTVFVLLIVGVSIFFIARKLANYGPTAFSVTSSQNRADNRASIISNVTRVISAPSKLFHGSDRFNAALDIVTQNRWLVKNHYPNGIYMAEDFKTAAGYAGSRGAVVEIAVTIPLSLIINYSEMPGDSDRTLDMGYRLIRNGNIYIAPTPKPTNNNEYFKVEGLRPFGLLDTKGNTIPINSVI